MALKKRSYAWMNKVIGIGKQLQIFQIQNYN